MANFMIAYYGGSQSISKEEGMAQMGKWKAWIDGLGDKVVNPGTPLMETKTITSSDVQDENDPNAMKGFAIVKAVAWRRLLKLPNQIRSCKMTEPFVFLK